MARILRACSCWFSAAARRNLNVSQYSASSYDLQLGPEITANLLLLACIQQLWLLRIAAEVRLWGRTD